MPEIVVRKLTEEDWRTERSLRLAALADAPSAFGSRLADAERFGEREWRSRISGQARFAALLDGVPVGTAGWASGMDPFPEDAALVVGVWVAPEVRGRAVGDRLLHAVIDDVGAAAGLARILLCVMRDNEPAVRLYRRHGFRPVELAFAPDEGEIHLELPLASGRVTDPA